MVTGLLTLKIKVDTDPVESRFAEKGVGMKKIDPRRTTVWDWLFGGGWTGGGSHG